MIIDTSITAPRLFDYFTPEQIEQTAREKLAEQLGEGVEHPEMLAASIKYKTIYEQGIREIGEQYNQQIATMVDFAVTVMNHLDYVMPVLPIPAARERLARLFGDVLTRFHDSLGLPEHDANIPELIQTKAQELMDKINPIRDQIHEMIEQWEEARNGESVQITH